MPARYKYTLLSVIFCKVATHSNTSAETNTKVTQPVSSVFLSSSFFLFFSKERMKQKENHNCSRVRSCVKIISRCCGEPAVTCAPDRRSGPARRTLQLTFPHGRLGAVQADTCSRPCRLLNMCQGRQHLFCWRRLRGSG